MQFEEILTSRRDTRHFCPTTPVPEEVLTRALLAASCAPSVGLSEPWRFVRITNQQTKDRLYEAYAVSRTEADKLAAQSEEAETGETSSQVHRKLKLEALREAPVLLAAFCNYPEGYTLGASTTNKPLEWSAACAIQNLWLSLTEQGYGLGWVSLLDLALVEKLLKVPNTWESMGILCIGKPLTDYQGIPMLELEGWKSRSLDRFLFDEGQPLT